MADVRCAHDERIPLVRLVPNPRNPNKHPERQVKLLAKIIEAQGWRAPITVSTRSGFIVRGHGRYEAAKFLQFETAPVDCQDYANEAEEWADLIADNRIAEFAEMDQDLLGELLRELDALDFDLEIAGFEDDALGELLSDTTEADGITDPDEIPPASENPISRPGDLWILGAHKVLCGDATNPQHVARLLDGDKTHMVFTDPPYNVNYEGKAGKIANDHPGDREFHALLLGAFKNMFRWVTDVGAIYVCYSDTEAVSFRQTLTEAGFKLSTGLVWRKNQFVIGRSDYHPQHEPILYGWKPTAGHRWFGGRKKSTIHELFDAETLRQTGENEFQVKLGDNVLVITGENLMVEDLLSSVISEGNPSRTIFTPP